MAKQHKQETIPGLEEDEVLVNLVIRAWALHCSSVSGPALATSQIINRAKKLEKFLHKVITGEPDEDEDRGS